jgi:transcriptional regulator with GAF, ATPase, and Fis domain
MQDIFRRAEAYARRDGVVIITGETGTGKGEFAKSIHGLSKRMSRVLEYVNCADIKSAEAQQLAMLFGAEPGAYPGLSKIRMGYLELADKSTIFFDEIQALPTDVQTMLNPVLDGLERSAASIRRLGGSKLIAIDVRMIFGTLSDPRTLVREGILNRDLFGRINVLQLHLPPLRERKEDIEFIVRREIDRTCKIKPELADGSFFDTLRDYDWPLNVRQLLNVVEILDVDSDMSGNWHWGATEARNAILKSALYHDVSAQVPDAATKSVTSDSSSGNCIHGDRALEHGKWAGRAVLLMKRHPEQSRQSCRDVLTCLSFDPTPDSRKSSGNKKVRCWICGEVWSARTAGAREFVNGLCEVVLGSRSGESIRWLPLARELLPDDMRSDRNIVESLGRSLKDLASVQS